mmetsp:Transcript_96500/g.297539  ORF Transcript_96500/g.297539 Transcript_96500/m.297539 type:complete len:287 (+) Transcript_96500:484-1344(+)
MVGCGGVCSDGAVAHCRQARGVVRVGRREALQVQGGGQGALPAAHGGPARGRSPGRGRALPGVPEGEGVRRGPRLPQGRAQVPHGLGLRQAAHQRSRLRLLRHGSRRQELEGGQGPHRIHGGCPQRSEAGQRPDPRRGHDDRGRPLHGGDELPLPRLGRRVGAPREDAHGWLRAAGRGLGLARGPRRLRQDPNVLPEPLQGRRSERHAGVLLQRHSARHTRLRQDQENVLLRGAEHEHHGRLQGGAHRRPLHGCRRPHPRELRPRKDGGRPERDSQDGEGRVVRVR